MTCREKLKLEYPGMVNSTFLGGCAGCPHHKGYLDIPEFCVNLNINKNERCTKCWDREIPDKKEEETVKTYFVSWFDTTTMTIGNCSIDVNAKVSGSELITKIIELVTKTVSKNAVVLTFQPV